MENSVVRLKKILGRTTVRLDYCGKKGESYYYPRPLREMPYSRTRDTKAMDRLLLRNKIW